MCSICRKICEGSLMSPAELRRPEVQSPESVATLAATVAHFLVILKSLSHTFETISAFLDATSPLPTCFISFWLLIKGWTKMATLGSV